jgi:hypothetical protein
VGGWAVSGKGEEQVLYALRRDADLELRVVDSVRQCVISELEKP